MAVEIARLSITPGSEFDSEAAARQAIPLFDRAAGCQSMRLLCSHEMQARYWLFVEWDSVRRMRPCARRLILPNGEPWSDLFFAGAPVVERGLEIEVDTQAR